MASIPKIIPISDLRQKTSEAIKGLSLGNPVVITQRGHAAAVMVSMKAYEHLQHELEILHLLARGEKEIEAGIGYELDDVLEEADQFLGKSKDLRILFTPAARRQFLAALDYIYQDNPSAAVNFRQKAEKTLSRLKEHPQSGRYLPEFPDLPYREVIVKPHRFFYRVKENTVWIVAVWHSAQLPNEPEE